MSELLRNDVDPVETSEWLQALESLLREEGPERARFIIDQLTAQARKAGVDLASQGGSLLTDYINTIATSDEPAYPGNKELEKRIRSIIRWNAAMIVLRASKKGLDLGGHMSSFASSATIYEVAFNSSSVPVTTRMAAIWSTSRATSLRASMPVPSSKGV